MQFLNSLPACGHCSVTAGFSSLYAHIYTVLSYIILYYLIRYACSVPFCVCILLRQAGGGSRPLCNAGLYLTNGVICGVIHSHFSISFIFVVRCGSVVRVCAAALSYQVFPTVTMSGLAGSSSWM